MVDTLCTALRLRLGCVVARVERLAAYGPLLASMDAEAVAWARKAVPAALIPDTATLEQIARGRGAGALNINLSSTRHLVICMQGILLGVPVKDRYDISLNAGESGAPLPSSLNGRSRGNSVEETAAVATMRSKGATGSNATSWIARKGRCDALLSLCNSFAQLAASQGYSSSSTERYK